MDHSRDGSTVKTDGSEGASMRKRVKVLLADDHTMFREGLAEILVSSYGDEVEVVGETKIGEEVVALAREKDPDVVVMQVDRTLKMAKDTLTQMHEYSSSPPKMVILTMFEDPRMVREIMEIGANAYIHKSVSVEELFAVLRVATSEDEGEHVVIAMPQESLELSEDGLGRRGRKRTLQKGARNTAPGSAWYEQPWYRLPLGHRRGDRKAPPG